MNNSGSGEESWHLGWDRCYLSHLSARRWLWCSSRLGKVCGHCLESSSLYLLLQNISTRLREITLLICNNASDLCDGNVSSRGWNNVIESLVIQEMALFPNIFHASGKKDCLSLHLCHIPAVLLFETFSSRLALLLFSMLNRCFIQLQHNHL